MAKIPLKYLPVAGILVLLCTVGYFLIKPGYQRGKGLDLEAIFPDTGLKIKNFHYSEDNLVLDADEGIYSRDKQRVTLNKFYLKLAPLNSPSMEIKGEKAEWDRSLKVINLRGNLQGYSNNGYGVFTEHLTYEQKDGVLKTDEWVKITGPFFSVNGKGLLCYLETQRFKIISDITALIEKGSLL
jgi:LPS export ABC transporter protein LptC